MKLGYQYEGFSEQNGWFRTLGVWGFRVYFGV